MNYRNFGNTDFKVSALGFGCLRLPVTDPGGDTFSPNVIEDEAIEMIRYAIDHGVNYVDTSYLYHSGKSEEVVGKALKDGYRQKTMLKTKSPVYLFKEAGDFDKYLNEQLKRLDVDFVDYYIFHSLDEGTWNNVMLKYDIFSKAEKAKRDGKIGHIGFSFHDRYDVFSQILNGYDKWELCMIQLNLMDTEYQAGLKGLKDAAAKGIPVEIMEPLLGGKLANPPKSVKELYASHPTPKHPVEWALDYLWDMPEVSCVHSGMSSLQQVKDNIAYAEQSSVGMLTDEDKKFLEQVQEKYKEFLTVQCTKCGYCMPCPIGVNIPNNLELYNQAFEDDESLANSKGFYATSGRIKGEARLASSCVGCKACEKKCPQHLEISALMPLVHEKLKA